MRAVDVLLAMIDAMKIKEMAFPPGTHEDGSWASTTIRVNGQAYEVEVRKVDMPHPHPTHESVTSKNMWCRRCRFLIMGTDGAITGRGVNPCNPPSPALQDTGHG